MVLLNSVLLFVLYDFFRFTSCYCDFLRLGFGFFGQVNHQDPIISFSADLLSINHTTHRNAAVETAKAAFTDVIFASSDSLFSSVTSPLMDKVLSS